MNVIMDRILLLALVVVIIFNEGFWSHIRYEKGFADAMAIPVISASGPLKTPFVPVAPDCTGQAFDYYPPTEQ